MRLPSLRGLLHNIEDNPPHFFIWLLEERPFQRFPRGLFGTGAWFTMAFVSVWSAMQIGLFTLPTAWILTLLTYFLYDDFKRYRRETGRRW